MDKTLCRNRLKELIQQETNYAKELLETLGKEKQVLASDPMAMQEIAAAKQQLVAHLEQLNRQRTQILHSLGLPTNRIGMNAVLKWCDNGKQVQSAWQNLLAIMQENRKNNMINGAILQSWHRITRQALGIISSRSLDSETYGCNGRTAAMDMGRRLGSA